MIEQKAAEYFASRSWKDGDSPEGHPSIVTFRVICCIHCSFGWIVRPAISTLRLSRWMVSRDHRVPLYVLHTTWMEECTDRACHVFLCGNVFRRLRGIQIGSKI